MKGIRYERTSNQEKIGAALPLLDLLAHFLKLVLEALPEDVDVVGGAVVDTPCEDGEEEDGAGPAVPEPDGAGQHGAERVGVLDEHEGGLLEAVGEGGHGPADPGFGVGLLEPGVGGRAAGGDLGAATHGDEEVVGELPDGVGERRPHRHGG
ncbi:hypothetical protein V492_01054 [Pseudogymnoascus sp. VKM F-4246]|nr:hypothetical protein V492_01054 [Pseudogymnoascus sp. VKM F-4246]